MDSINISASTYSEVKILKHKYALEVPKCYYDRKM
jgi:hypothetical protein